MAGKLLELTDANFKDELGKTDLPVVVDFRADWCGPCRMVGPALEALAEEMEGEILFAQVDIDKNPMVAGEFGVMSIPTFIVFKGGSVAGQFSGALPKDQLKAKILEMASGA